MSRANKPPLLPRWAGYYADRPLGLNPKTHTLYDPPPLSENDPLSIANAAVEKHMLALDFNNYKTQGSPNPKDWNWRTWIKWSAFMYKLKNPKDGPVSQPELAGSIEARWAPFVDHERVTPVDTLEPSKDIPTEHMKLIDELFGLFFFPAAEPSQVPALVRYVVETNYMRPYLKQGAISEYGVDYTAVHMSRFHGMHGVTPAQMKRFMERRSVALEKFVKKVKSDDVESQEFSDRDREKFVSGKFGDMIDHDCTKYLDPEAWTGIPKTKSSSEYVVGTELVESDKIQTVFGKMSEGDNVDGYKNHPRLRAYVFTGSMSDMMVGLQWSMLANQAVGACIIAGNGREMLFPLRFVVHSGSEGAYKGDRYDFIDEASARNYHGALLFPVHGGVPNVDHPRIIKPCMVFPVFAFMNPGGGRPPQVQLCNFEGRKVERGSVHRRKHGTYLEMNQVRCMQEGKEWRSQFPEGVTVWKLYDVPKTLENPALLLTEEAKRHVFVSTRTEEVVRYEVKKMINGVIDHDDLSTRVKALVEGEPTGEALIIYRRVWLECLQPTRVLYNNVLDTLVFARESDGAVKLSKVKPCMKDAYYDIQSEQAAYYGGTKKRGRGGKKASGGEVSNAKTKSEVVEAESKAKPKAESKPKAETKTEPKAKTKAESKAETGALVAPVAVDAKRLAADALTELLAGFRKAIFIPRKVLVNNTWVPYKFHVKSDFTTRVLGRRTASAAPGKYPDVFLYDVWKLLSDLSGAPRVTIVAANSNIFASVQHVFKVRGWDRSRITVVVTSPSRMSVFDVGGGVRLVNAGPYMDPELVEQVVRQCGAEPADLVMTDTDDQDKGVSAARKCLGYALIAAKTLRPGGRLLQYIHYEDMHRDLASAFPYQCLLSMFDALEVGRALADGRGLHVRGAGFRRADAAVSNMQVAFAAAAGLRAPPAAALKLAWRGRDAFLASLVEVQRRVPAQCARFLADRRPLLVKARAEVELIHAELAATYGTVPGFAVPSPERLFELWIRIREMKASGAFAKEAGAGAACKELGVVAHGTASKTKSGDEKPSKVRAKTKSGDERAGGSSVSLLDPGVFVVRRSDHVAPNQNYPPCRVLDHDNDPGLQYDAESIEAPPRCHWGQRKLLFSEIEFLTVALAELRAPPSEFCVVYVGAASGEHQAVLQPLFPGLAWQLYDKAAFRFGPGSLGADVQVFTGRDGFFTDATVPLAAARARGRRVLFISDIRLEDRDEAVFKDMELQRDWGTRLAAERMLLKFRLPFRAADWAQRRPPVPRGGGGGGGTGAASAKKPSRLAPHVSDSRVVRYLDGDILFQVHAPMNSSESRLLVRRDADGTYPSREYDVIAYQDQMFYFNEVTRHKAYRVPDDTLLSWHIAGMDNGYDSVVEYLIAERYLTWRNRGKNGPGKAGPGMVVGALSEWDRGLERCTGRALWDCDATTVRSFSEKKDESATARKRARLWTRYMRDAMPDVEREQARVFRAVAALPAGAGGRLLDAAHYAAGADAAAARAAAGGNASGRGAVSRARRGSGRADRHP